MNKNIRSYRGRGEAMRPIGSVSSFFQLVSLSSRRKKKRGRFKFRSSGSGSGEKTKKE